MAEDMEIIEITKILRSNCCLHRRGVSSPSPLRPGREPPGSKGNNRRRGKADASKLITHARAPIATMRL